MSNKRENSNILQTEAIISKWLNLSETEKNILGRPNFACASIAERMRQMGVDCPRKAEAEQAIVIFTMLEFYKEFSEEWSNRMSEWLTFKNDNT